MPRPDRSLTVGWGRLAMTLLFASCGGGTGSQDAALPAPDGPAPEVTEAAALPPPHPDLRVGFTSGSACDTSTQCLSGACPLGICSEWSYAMRIAVDTTISGAAVQEPVESFPLLVRLSSAFFSFGEARPDGSDVRFVDGAGRALPHEIERWDRQAGTAEAWVSVPRIEGNSRDNFVLMYWGNPLATAVSEGPSVFESFSSVLHMTDEGEGVASHLADSSGHSAEGSLQHPDPAAAPTEGLAAFGLGLDGRDTYVTIATRMTMPAAMSVSLWFRTTSAAGGGLLGLAKLDEDDAELDRTLWLDESGRLSFTLFAGTATALLRSLASYNDGAWHMAVARVSNAGPYLFVDGEPVADGPGMRSSGLAGGFWRFGDGALLENTVAVARRRFQGTLDEIRIVAPEESDAWIKLAYATGRPGSTVVSYQRIP